MEKGTKGEKASERCDAERAEILEFKATPGFGKWKEFFPEEAKQHPAKASCYLLDYLIRTYTKEGDTVLDPMAGCYDDMTEILTKRGWLKFREVELEDEVCTLNPNTNEMEYQKIIRKVHDTYDGLMYQVKTKQINLLVTPNHWMFVAPRDSRIPKSKWKYRRIQAKDMAGKWVAYKKDGIWKGKNSTTFTLPSVTYKHKLSNGNEEIKQIPEREIDINDWLYFLGYWIAEGHVDPNYPYSVCVSVSDKEKQNKVLSMIKRTFPNAHINGHHIRIFSKQLASYLAPLRYAPNKHIPNEIKELSPDLLRILFEAYIDGDGHRWLDPKRKIPRTSAWTSSTRLRDDLQEIALKMGFSANYYLEMNAGEKNYMASKKRYITATVPNWCISFNFAQNHPIVYIKKNEWNAKKRNIKTSCKEEWVHYRGNIWCVEVPNHIIYVRREGKVVWCGNSGSTGVLSALNGRNAILIELEEKFCEWIREAIKRVEQQQTTMKKGKIIVIQGDARNTPALLKEHTGEISSIITSPPFAGTSGGKGEKSRAPINERYSGVFDRCIGGNKGALSNDPKQIDNLKYGIVDDIILSPPYGNRLADNALDDDDERGRMKYSHIGANNMHNIGFLPLIPQADSIIFSPPYSLGHDSGDKASEKYSERLKEQRKHTRAYSPENIAKMPLGLNEGIDSILFSPPYADSLSTKANIEKRVERLKRLEYNPKRIEGRVGCVRTNYSDSKANIGNLGYASVDEIITSPPYESSLEGGSRTHKGGIASRDPKITQTETYATTLSSGIPIGYSADDANIENLKSSEDEYAELSKDKKETTVKEMVNAKNGEKNSTQVKSKETYLSAMLEVYKGCFEVLKPEGRMILIVKNFIRDKKLVPLSEHTIHLCQSVGFSLEKHLLFKLPQTSFWRTLERKKWEKEGREYPEDLSYEHVLMFRK